MSSTEENSNSPATTPRENEPSGESSGEADPRDLEKIEDEKLKSKYPSGMRVPGGHSAFLHKRLQKGQKFFDSGDYQMAKQKAGGVKQVSANNVATGEAIPTPETVSARKISIMQPCKKFPTSS